MLPQRATQLFFILVVSLFLIAPSTLSASQQYNPVTHTNLPCCSAEPLAVDVNGDGRADVLDTTVSEVRVWFSNGDGTFQPDSIYPSGGYLHVHWRPQISTEIAIPTWLFSIVASAVPIAAVVLLER